MIIAYLATIGFCVYYFILGIPILAYTAVVAFCFFVIYGVVSIFNKHLVLLFRLSIVVIFWAFFLQVFYTGGISSPSIPQFFIASIVTLFYKPHIDRYVMITLSFIATIVMFLLSHYGYTENLIPEDLRQVNSLICYLFIMLTFLIYLIMFRDSLLRKNRKLSESIANLQSTTSKLIESEKMQSIAMLTSGLAHELNNPLNYVSGLLKPIDENIQELLPLLSESEKEKALPLIEEIQEFLSVINVGAEKASFIIKKLIHISPQGDWQDIERFDLTETLKISTQIIKESNPDLDFEVELPDELVMYANQIEVNQMFVNIIENSVEALNGNKTGGWLKLKGDQVGDEIRIQIEDNGMGMDEHVQKHLFEPFYSNKGPGQGTGLGLYISKSIANKYGGTIAVTSAPNEGSRFDIVFPASENGVDQSGT